MTKMNADKPLITCIYCRQLRPPSNEHVLASSLGGNAISPITCKPCNTTILSSLDQAIAERSLVALSRLSDTPPDAFDVRLSGEHFHYDKDHDIYAETNMVNGVRAALFPQIHHKLGTSDIAVIATNHDDVKSLVAFVDKHITNGTLRSLHVKYGPAERCTTARLVMHRSKEGFIRVRSTGDELLFFEKLENGWPALRTNMISADRFVATTEEKPTIEIHMAVRLDDTFRAIAKTAFNVLAMRLGSDVALSREFDELRDYVLGRDLRRPAHLEPGQLAVDGRFVRMLPFGQPPLVPTEEHAVTLFHARGRMLAYVTLYKYNSFIVVLGTLDWPESVIATHEFSAVRAGNSALEIEEVYERMTTRKPNV